MLKRMSIRKIVVSTLTLFALFLIYLLPNNNDLKDVKQELEYVNYDVLTHNIFLLDSNNFIAKTSVVIKSTSSIDIATELVEILIIDGKGESNIPSGFKSIIPSDTKINKVSLKDGLYEIDFSEDFLSINKLLEEKMLEALVFSITSVDDINKVKITIEGRELKCLPNSKVSIPSILDRSFGINKEYDITSSKDVESVTIYYINKYNDNYYYVPVTKYLNTTMSKIEVIIEQLKNPSITTDLMSFISDNVELISSDINDKTINLVFNDYIFSNFDEKEILEEVIYTISLSIGENYDVEDVIFTVNDEEITKSVIKSIETD